MFVTTTKSLKVKRQQKIQILEPGMVYEFSDQHGMKLLHAYPEEVQVCVQSDQGWEVLNLEPGLWIILTTRRLTPRSIWPRFEAKLCISQSRHIGLRHADCPPLCAAHIDGESKPTTWCKRACLSWRYALGRC